MFQCRGRREACGERRGRGDHGIGVGGSRVSVGVRWPHGFHRTAEKVGWGRVGGGGGVIVGVVVGVICS